VRTEGFLSKGLVGYNMKRYGLKERHTILIENLMKNTEHSLGAGHIKDLLWDSWGRNVPTPRQIGTFLKTHPQMKREKNTKRGAEYLWVY
tara:strand:- start:2699 stop:2968 length:270 start_codon:yes stop_codon:yes gene_type:complete